ncbi:TRANSMEMBRANE PROTEIN [Salix purpurea]|uniref:TRANSMEMBRANE PROTEIN n=1 Tax=Salix purpurea TaxID=77065 RepID=A0A9Q0ZFE8_SALPP|nr:TRANSMEMBRANE PROTEIN [Salix purpurea]
MARAVAVGAGHCWSHSKTVILIWCICIFFYIFFFRMALQNSSSSSSSSDKNTEQRSRLYDTMERGLDESGAAFLKHGETSQSLFAFGYFHPQEWIYNTCAQGCKPSCPGYCFVS